MQGLPDGLQVEQDWLKEEQEYSRTGQAERQLAEQKGCMLSMLDERRSRKSCMMTRLGYYVCSEGDFGIQHFDRHWSENRN